MSIRFVCPYGHRLKVPNHRAGKKGRCPVCQQRLIVPEPNPQPSGKAKLPPKATAPALEPAIAAASRPGTIAAVTPLPGPLLSPVAEPRDVLPPLLDTLAPGPSPSAAFREETHEHGATLAPRASMAPAPAPEPALATVSNPGTGAPEAPSPMPLPSPVAEPRDVLPPLVAMLEPQTAPSAAILETTGERGGMPNMSPLTAGKPEGPSAVAQPDKPAADKPAAVDPKSAVIRPLSALPPLEGDGPPSHWPSLQTSASPPPKSGVPIDMSAKPRAAPKHVPLNPTRPAPQPSPDHSKPLSPPATKRPVAAPPANQPAASPGQQRVFLPKEAPAAASGASLRQTTNPGSPRPAWSLEQSPIPVPPPQRPPAAQRPTQPHLQPSMSPAAQPRVSEQTSAQDHRRAAERRPWIVRPPEPGAARGAAPDPQHLETVYWLATALVFVVIFSAGPALPYLDLSRAPAWAQVVLLIAGLQLVYVAWLVTLPDWSTVWVGMLLFAFVAALYGMGMAMVAATPKGQPPLLDLMDVRSSAGGWCGAIVLLMGLLSYACGRISSKWQRTWTQRRLRSTSVGRAAG